MKRTSILLKVFGILLMTIVVSCTLAGSPHSNNRQLEKVSANSELDSLLRLMNINIEANNVDLAKSYYDKAIAILNKEKNYEGILDCSKQIAAIDTTYIRPYEMAQYALSHMGLYEEALDASAIIDKMYEDAGNFQGKHVNLLFTGMIAFDAKDYDLALNTMGAAIRDDYVIKEYGYLAYCYLSATYAKLNNERMANELKKVALQIKEEGTEEYIKRLIDR